MIVEEWLHSHPHQRERMIFERRHGKVELGSTIPERPTRADQLSGLLRKPAAKAGIKLAVSNPCFELWLLLHHESSAGHCANCVVVERRLIKCVPAYDKTRLRFGDFAAGLDHAVERAKSLEVGGNPSTDVWELVSAPLERE